MLQDKIRQQINQLPGLGNVPILGALFRSRDFIHSQTELVIVVTPHIVTPRRGEVAMPGGGWLPPSDIEMFLLGAQTGRAETLKPEDRVLLTADPKSIGVDGPHGHVLY